MTCTASFVVPELKPCVVDILRELGILIALHGLDNLCCLLVEHSTRLCPLLSVKIKLCLILNVEIVYKVVVMTCHADLYHALPTHVTCDLG